MTEVNDRLVTNKNGKPGAKFICNSKIGVGPRTSSHTTHIPTRAVYATEIYISWELVRKKRTQFIQD